MLLLVIGGTIFTLWYVVTYPNDIMIDYLDDILNEFQEYEKHLQDHIYLHNTYEPVAEEHHIPVTATIVEGMIPNDLHGVFIQNGPNPIPEHIGKKRYHWFDGHGLLHNTFIQGGGSEQTAHYTNAYIPTPRYYIEKYIKHEEYFLRFGEVKGIIGILKAVVLDEAKRKLFSLSNLRYGQANTHTIMTKENKLYATHEGSLPFEIQLNENGTLIRGVGYEDFLNTLNYPISAHPKIDNITGNMLFHDYGADPTLVKNDGNYKVGEYSINTKQVQTYYGIRTADNHTSFGHDLMFTKNYFVLYDNSVHFDTKQILNDTGNIFTWTPTATLKIGLAPRYPINSTNANNDVKWFDVGTPHIMIHPLNAWEEDNGNTIVMWSPVGNSFDIDISRGNNIYHMTEFRMNILTKQITMNIINNQYNVEFSRIRDDHYGQFIRYGITGIMEPKLGGDALFKGFVLYDMYKKNIADTFIYRNGDIGGEPIVIAKPNTKNHFYVGTYITNIIQKKSYLQLFDIIHNNENNSNNNNDDDEQHMIIRNITRIEMPYRIPTGFHCNWIPYEQLMAHVNYHKDNNIHHNHNQTISTTSAYDIHRNSGTNSKYKVPIDTIGIIMIE